MQAAIQHNHVRFECSIREPGLEIRQNHLWVTTISAVRHAFVRWAAVVTFSVKLCYSLKILLKIWSVLNGNTVSNQGKPGGTWNRREAQAKESPYLNPCYACILCIRPACYIACFSKSLCSAFELAGGRQLKSFGVPALNVEALKSIVFHSICRS